MKSFKLLLGTALLFAGMSSCTMVSVDPDEEAVIVDKPLLFGHGGVREGTVKPGLSYTWFTSKAVYFKTVPMRLSLDFDDIMSNDNTPLDYKTYIVFQIEQGKADELYKNYGPKWYENNLEAIYCNYVRDEVSKYSPFDLMSNREICSKIDSTIKSKMNLYISGMSETKEMPVVCKEVVTGKAKPNAKQLEEMNNTAAAIQMKQTQERKMEMEIAREKAEKQRAKADKAYMEELNLSPSQFIQLRAWEVIEKKQGANIDVLVSPTADPVWNVRR